MEKLTDETKALMEERFGHDTILALATVEDGVPHVRSVDAYYEDRAFYIITYGLSNKMRHISKNPVTAVSGVHRSRQRRKSGLFWKAGKRRDCRNAEEGLCRLD